MEQIDEPDGEPKEQKRRGAGQQEEGQRDNSHQHGDLEEQCSSSSDGACSK